MELVKLRKQIDAADKALLKALAKRFQATHKVGIFKAKHEFPIVDKKREKEMFITRKAWGKSLDLDEKIIQQIFQLILKKVYTDHRGAKKLNKNL